MATPRSLQWRARAPSTPGTLREVLLAEGAGVIVVSRRGPLCITELQSSGPSGLPAADFLRGMPIATAAASADSKFVDH